MKIWKKSINWLLLGTLVSSLPLISCTTSNYNSNFNANVIKLSIKQPYLEVGKSIQVYVNNGTESATNYNWSVETPTNQIYILHYGLLCASPDLKITEPISVTVCATSKTNEAQKAYITIDVPNDTSDVDNNFLGFRNGSVEYIDMYDKRQKNRVIRDETNKYLYRLEKPIDVRCITERQDDHIVNLTPILRDNCRRTMKWNTWSETPRAIIFGDGYEEDNDTEICPSIFFLTPRYFKTKIFVKFMCNGFKAETTPTLEIDFNVWMPSSETIDTTYFSYNPKDENDKHSLVPGSTQGEYKMKLFCPSHVTTGTYSNLLTTIYCFRNLRVYTDLTFEMSLDAILPEKFKKAFKIEISSVETIRPFDDFVMYKLSVAYSFDLSQIPTPQEVEYKQIVLGKLLSIDGNGASRGWIQLEVEWI